MKLNVKAFSLSSAIVIGLAVLGMTYWWLIFGWDGHILGKLKNLFLGYSVSWLGGIIGLLWGFVHGFIGGAIFAFLYNKFSGSADKAV